MLHSIGRIVLALSVVLGFSFGSASVARAQLPQCSVSCTCSSLCLKPCNSNGTNTTCGNWGFCRRDCRIGALQAALVRVGLIAASADTGCADAEPTASDVEPEPEAELQSLPEAQIAQSNMPQASPGTP